MADFQSANIVITSFQEIEKAVCPTDRQSAARLPFEGEL
jgi:hypothetical protein